MPAPHRNHQCSRCTYSVAGLPARGTCPECGSKYDTIDGVPLTLREQVYTFPRRLLIGLRDASPWLAERYLPSSRTVTTAAPVIIHSAILVAIGVIIADALSGGQIFGRGSTPRATGPGFISEMTATTLMWAPLFLALYAAAVAIQGIARHRIVITPSAIVTGYQARIFGLISLAAAAGLFGLFVWVRVSIP